jgi:Helix-turn-helix domain
MPLDNEQISPRSVLDGLATEDELSAEIKKTKRTLREWRQRGVGPPFVRLGETIYYPREKVREWIASLIKEPVRAKRRA